MSTPEVTDLVVAGSGAAGFAAAITARRAGLDRVTVEVVDRLWQAAPDAPVRWGPEAWARLQTALELYELRRLAAGELEANASRLADNESLARRSYEVGQIGLAELLLVRRETLDARRERLDSLLELARARADIESLQGGTQ